MFHPDSIAVIGASASNVGDDYFENTILELPALV